jgi:DnaJ homolog subfamily C member 30
MYDKGGLYDTGTADMTETTEQAAVSKFYKSRGQTYSGKTPIYDYDEWSKNHYGKMFDRREKAKARYSAQVRLYSFKTELI